MSVYALRLAGLQLALAAFNDNSIFFFILTVLVIDIPDRLMTLTLKPITINIFFRVWRSNEPMH